MTITNLIVQTNNQVSLLKSLIESHSKDIETYPSANYSAQSLICLEHCCETLKRLNELLVRPFEQYNK